MSKLQIVAYYSGIPPKNKNLEKPQILDNFVLGVERVGDIAIKNYDIKPILSDLAVIQGFVHNDGKKLPHLELRKAAFELQKKNRKKTLLVDSNLFLYKDKTNQHNYLRYSFDGVFPTTGFYFDDTVDDSRWLKIKHDLNLDLKEYRNQGEHILICLQRNGGWSMQGLNTIHWLDYVITTIRKYTQRKIIIRPHPGDRKTVMPDLNKYHNVNLSVNETLIADLSNAWATVVYNSSPAVASVLEGIPVFITDADPKNSQAYDVGNFNLKNIETPIFPTREQWIKKLCMCHWNFDELKSGEAWTFFRKFIV